MKKKKVKKLKTRTQTKRPFHEEVYARLMECPFNEDEEKSETANVITEIDLGYFSGVIDVVIAYQDNLRMMRFSMASSSVYSEKDRFNLQCAINEMNTHFMKLGCFAVATESMDVYFIATVTLYADEGNYEGKMFVVESLVVGGVQAFMLLEEVLTSGIDTAINKYIQTNMKQQEGDVGLLH
jgi:hypothetical protein